MPPGQGGTHPGTEPPCPAPRVIRRPPANLECLVQGHACICTPAFPGSPPPRGRGLTTTRVVTGSSGSSEEWGLPRLRDRRFWRRMGRAVGGGGGGCWGIRTQTTGASVCEQQGAISSSSSAASAGASGAGVTTAAGVGFGRDCGGFQGGVGVLFGEGDVECF